MKQLFSFSFLLLQASFLFSQSNSGAPVTNPSAGSVNTYAVIVGIANYENENINLNYANRDAQVFATYLQSKAGGSVPEENIRLLIDTNATTAAIYNSLNWLRERCELEKMQNDGKTTQVYFYFSGHGDVETDTKANLGFLISFNTPPNNYINNAVRIEDLNNYAHTLSVDLGANVVIITDACHSGKLAGSDNKGSFLVGKELSTAREREIRIASCNPDELSNEDERWGGGRGVFSWYLINGLKGLADNNHDNIVTLSEIKRYVDSCITADPILKQTKRKQTPVLQGNQQYQLAAVDRQEFLTVTSAMFPAPVVKSDHEIFFDLLKNKGELEGIDYRKLAALPRERIPLAFVNEYRKIADTGISTVALLTQLETGIRNDKEKLKQFSESLVELLHTWGQRIINLYLQGDEAELERRRYYYSKSSGYDAYPDMYATAMKLTDSSNSLYRILRFNQYYFSGVAARIKLPIVMPAEQKLLLDKAMAAQSKALQLEDNAAYIHNELGILYLYKKDNILAEKYFKNATNLAPEWAVPWANLCGLYAVLNKNPEAIAAGEAARGLQPELQLASSNLGLAYETAGNLLFAEEFYREAIAINSRHYLPFERLGYVYMNTTKYEMADSFFHEADIRKRGYHFKANGLVAVPESIVLGPAFPFFCEVDTSVLEKDDIMAFFTWGVQEYGAANYDNARRILKKVVAVDKTNPLVFHYLGKTFYDQEKWEEAELMFRLAEDYYRDSASFDKYCDSLIKQKKYRYPHDCFETFFKGKYYKRVEDYYFLATLYESWGHYDEAETYYRKVIAIDSANIGGYVKLWKMMEKLDRHTEAEKLIKNYAPYDKERSERELNAFYRRAILRYPETADWYYRLGLLLYERAPFQSKELYLDSIIWFPKQNREVFIDMENYKKIGSELSWDITVKGSPLFVVIKNIEETAQIVLLPGINEYLTLSGAIYTPRKDAITYLLKADSLLNETEIKADIHFKAGNVFVWAGSKKQAYPYYLKSVELSPGNANARLNLADVCKAIYKNRKGFEQLSYLYDSAQINFPKRMLYAEWCIHAGQFEKAKKILEEAQAIHPYILPEAFDLLGRLNMLARQPAQAISFYKQYLVINKNDAAVLYSIARLYAGSGNATEAWKWLEQSLKNGFNYGYVLDIDAAWTNLRKTPKWVILMKLLKKKKYFEPPVQP